MAHPKHSIVVWDACFRSFFHLLGSLAGQDYDLTTVEVIFVEQRSRERAAAWAAKNGVRSAEETVAGLGGGLNVRFYFLNEAPEHPYHPGRLLNFGLLKARGEILSTMDIDMLVPPIFLQMLDGAHQQQPRLVNIYRYMAAHPCGVEVADWTKQTIDYWKVFPCCRDFWKPIPPRVDNYAPLISVHRDHWKAIGYYDTHRLFSTPHTLFGRDVAARLGLLLGDVEHMLPIAAVHPWHPNNLVREKDLYQALQRTQWRLLEYSIKQWQPHVQARRALADEIYAAERETVEAAIAAAEAEM